MILLHELPADILIAFLCCYDLKHVLKLEQTCRTIRDIVSTRQVWLAQLRRLDQAHAPNLPIHVDVLTLELKELREIVTTAVRAYDNCLNGTFGRTTRNYSNEISIKLNPPDSFSVICNATLVPGRNFLFVRWSCARLQLVDTRTRKAVWTYPDENNRIAGFCETAVAVRRWQPLSIESLLDTMDFDFKNKTVMHNYDVDFRADGSAFVVCYLIRRRVSGRAHSNYDLAIDVHHINFENLEILKLYSKVIESENELRALRVIVQGDFVALLCIATDDIPSESYVLTIGNYITDEFVHARLPQAVHNQLRPKIAVIREHLLLVDHDSNGFSSVRMLDIRHLFSTVLPDSRLSPSLNKTADIGELGFSNLVFEVPHTCVIEEATAPSLCSFHWKEEGERFDILSMQIDMRLTRLGKGSPVWSVLHRYAFKPRISEAEPPSLSLISANLFSPVRNGSPVSLHCLIQELPLSTRALMRLTPLRKTTKPDFEFVISTPIDRTGDVRSTLAVSSVPRRLGVHRFDVDHLSGAIISYTGRKDGRWIRIVYPA